MNRFLLQAIAVTLSASATINCNAFHYRISGTAIDKEYAEGKTIYMRHDKQIIDSTVVKDGKYIFEGNLDKSKIARIDITGREFALSLIENGNMEITMTRSPKYSQPVYIGHTSSTPGNITLNNIRHYADSISAKIQKETARLKEQGLSGNEIDNHTDSLLHGELLKLWDGHYDDLFGQYILHCEPMFWADDNTKSSIVRQFGPWLSEQPDTKKFISELETRLKTSEGKPFINITGTDITGSKLSVSDFIGKGRWILVDMWASWCGPCIGSIPRLREIAEKYSDRLDIVGIFTWDKSENFATAIKKHNITWPQICDGNKTAMTAYGVNYVPYTILISPDGTIHSRSINLDELDNIMQNIPNP